MKQKKFPITLNDEAMVDLVRRTDQKKLARWAIDCTKRVLPYFETQYPQDRRPRLALETLYSWMQTGVCKMARIRTASLAAHAAAREVGEDNSARSAARSAGQAVATAHVPIHALGAALYALQAVHRAAIPAEADAAVARERNWQYHHLHTLGETS